MIKLIALVGIGGAIGSVLRFYFGKMFSSGMYHGLPLATLLVNVVGCFIIGLLWANVLKYNQATHWKALLITGFCGGFTTFSTFSIDAIMLLKQNKIGLFGIYIFGSLVLGLLATIAGLKIAES